MKGKEIVMFERSYMVAADVVIVAISVVVVTVVFVGLSNRHVI